MAAQAPIKAIVFDKDGTLVDFQATWGAWSLGLLRDEARGDPDRLRALSDAIGYDIENRVFRADSIVIASTTDLVADRILAHLPGETKSALMARMDARAATAPQVEAAPLRPLLAELRGRGLRLGIATNDTEAPARAHLAAAGVEEMFDFIAGYDSGHGGKPAPGQLVAFAEAVAVDPAHCAMVGDSLHDLHAARAAGMVAVAVLTGIAGHADLAADADVVLASIAELPDWLDGRA